MSRSAVISALARSLCAGESTVAAVLSRARRTLGHDWRWLPPLSHRYIAAFEGRIRPRHREVVQFLLQDTGFRRACVLHRERLTVAEWLHEPNRMQPVGVAKDWDLPVIETVGDLAQWLSLNVNELEWFADLKGLCHKRDSPNIQHYHYRLMLKRSGGVRLIESPKRELKELQRRILSTILDRIPPHECVHGFVKGRSIVTFAAPHAGRRVALRLDLENFFPASPGSRVQSVFRTLGYPEPVADRLGGICSNVTPRSVWHQHPLGVGAKEWREARILYSRPHLPQGAPTSPALGNVMAFRLDCRLSGLARTAGATYTRYADDLAFSGGEEFCRGVERFSAHVAAIAMEEGFSVNHRKTRIMRRGVRQSLAGTVVNEGINIRRRDFEILKATLTNCVRFGPESQNRERLPYFRAHLEGRIGFVEMINRSKGQQLRQILRRVEFREGV